MVDVGKWTLPLHTQPGMFVSPGPMLALHLHSKAAGEVGRGLAWDGL